MRVIVVASVAYILNAEIKVERWKRELKFKWQRLARD